MGGGGVLGLARRHVIAIPFFQKNSSNMFRNTMPVTVLLAKKREIKSQQKYGELICLGQLFVATVRTYNIFISNVSKEHCELLWIYLQMLQYAWLICMNWENKMPIRVGVQSSPTQTLGSWVRIPLEA
jgi:hypothetical protein